ncbi:MAG: nitrite reductase small subunit NirD [Alteromonadaceae bacterium]|nr:nitrite reductase small subunit NirD [Alteromonadaceae bacterium]
MSKWVDICNLDEILPNMGRCALFEDQQVAIFRVIKAGKELLYAINNYCPFSEANVLSRGIIGSLADKVVIASPIYKQHFDLTNGLCVEDESVSLKTYEVRLEGNTVQLAG